MKISKIIIFIVCSIIGIIHVNATECSNEEKVLLKKESVDVKISFEEATGIDDSNVIPPDGYDEDEYIQYYNYFVVSFYNLTDNMVVEVTHDESGEKFNIKYDKTTDGTYSFDWFDINKVNTFRYKIIASPKTNCSSEVLKTGVLNLPAYNPYHAYSKCKGLEDYSLCQKYINANLTYDEFVKKIDKKIASEKNKEKEEQKEENKKDKFKKIIKKNKTLIIIIGAVLVGLTGGVIVIINKKKRGRAI